MKSIHRELRGLYAITDSQLCGALGVVEAARCALVGGARLVQYRDKSPDRVRRLEEATALASLCRDHGALFIVNDDVALAAEIPSAGVHIGRDDGSLGQARVALGPQRIIGVSCYHRLELAVQAQHEGADYIAFGRFFDSTTKPGTPLATLALLERARARLELPVAAIGGIDATNGAALVTHGASMLACIHGVFGQPDIVAAARAIAGLFSSGQNR